MSQLLAVSIMYLRAFALGQSILVPSTRRTRNGATTQMSAVVRCDKLRLHYYIVGSTATRRWEKGMGIYRPCVLISTDLRHRLRMKRSTQAVSLVLRATEYSTG